MYNRFSTGVLRSFDDWKGLRWELDPGVPDSKGKSNGEIVQSSHLLGVLNSFRDIEATYYIHEHIYIDRDFVDAYASFYHRTHRSQPKHCSRIHFFKADLSQDEDLPPDELAMSLEAAEPDYLGFAVLRPVRHAPLHRAGDIRKPLLIGQGSNDPRVKQAESDQMVAAMEAHGVPVTYVVYPDEGHGFHRPPNRMSFNTIVEAFLAHHLGGEFEPVSDADLTGSTHDLRSDVEWLKPMLRNDPQR